MARLGEGYLRCEFTATVRTIGNHQLPGSSECQFTVSENGVECCNEPEVALSVMVYVADCGADETPGFTLPHPLSKLSPIPPTMISTAN